MERRNEWCGFLATGFVALLGLGTLASGAQEHDAVELAAARARLLLAIERDADAALAALDELAGNEGAAAVVASARGEMLAALGRAPQPAQQGVKNEQEPGAPPLRETVLQLAKLGHADKLRDLGSPALRILEQLTLESWDRLAVGDVDPLPMLFQIAPLDTARFLLDHVEGANESFHRRILREMTQKEVITKAAWDCPAGRPPTLLEPIWLDLLEKLSSSPGSTRAALPMFGELAKRDALTPPLVEALRGALFSDQPDLAKEAYLAISEAPRVASVKPLFEALLDHPESAMRVTGARMLANYDHLGRLLEKVDSDDVELRRELARALVRDSYDYLVYHSNCAIGLRMEMLAFPRSEEVPAILALVGDDDDQVRRHAALAAPSQWIELPRATLLRLAREAAPEVRQAVALLPVSNPFVLNELLTELAADRSRDVARLVVRRFSQHDWTALPTVLLPALKRFLFESPYADTSEAKNEAYVDEALKGVWRVPEAAAAVVDWALERDHAGVVAQFVAAVTSGTYYQGFVELPTERALEVVRRAARGTGSNVTTNELRLFIRKLEGHKAPAVLLAGVAAIDEVPLTYRMSALGAALRSSDRMHIDPSYLLSGILDVLKDPEWLQGEPPARRDLLGFANAAGAELWNRVVAVVLADPSFDPHLVERIAAQYSPLAPGGNEVARSILTRWPLEGPGSVDAIPKTLQNAGALGLEPELLMLALERYPLDALEAMRRSRDPLFLEGFVRALEPDWLPYGGDYRGVQQYAITGLAGLLSDDAARALLAFAERAPDDGMRKEAFEALDTIRTYQEARERWERRVAERDARDLAVTRLVAMLGEEDATRRAAAVRALGELGEVSALPRIAELVADANPTVRTAAIEALGRLRRAEAPEAPTPSPPTPPDEQ